MKLILFTLFVVLSCEAQRIPPVYGTVCGGLVTTNCTPQIDANGNLMIGNTLLLRGANDPGNSNTLNLFLEQQPITGIGTYGSFGCTLSENGNGSSGTVAEPDDVVGCGWNLGAGMAPRLAGKPAFGFSWERNWGSGPSDMAAEWWMHLTTAAGVNYRPMGTVIDRVTGASQVFIRGTKTYFGSGGYYGGPTDTQYAFFDGAAKTANFGYATYSAATGGEIALNVTPTISQTGSAGFTAIGANLQTTSVGSGGLKLIDLQVGGQHRFTVDLTGNITSNNTFYDPTPVTGVTAVIFKAGAGNSSANDLVTWRDNNNQFMGRIRGDGTLQSEYSTSDGLSVALSSANGVQVAAAKTIGWSSSTNAWGSRDTFLGRIAPGVVGVGTAAGNVLGKIALSQSTPVASTDTCTPGSLWADAGYIYACTASGVIKRAALTAF